MSCESRECKHVVVIGAGIAGITTAHFLRQNKAFEDASITVLEGCSEPGSCASYMNGAILVPGRTYPWPNPGSLKQALQILNPWGKHVFQLYPVGALFDGSFYTFVKHFLQQMGTETVKANHAASCSLAVLSQRVMLDLPLSFDSYARTATGTLEVYSSAERRAAVFSTYAEERAHGLDVVPVDRNGCAKLVPELSAYSLNYECGHFVPADSNGDIGLFVRRLAEHLVARDRVTLKTSTRAVSFVQDSTTRRVTGVQLSDGSTLNCTDVVIAAGNESPNLGRQLGDTIVSYPVKGYVLTVPIVENAEPFRVNIIDDTNKVYTTCLGRSVRASGLVDFGSPNTPMPERTQELTTAFLKLIPKNYLQMDKLHVHSCERPQTPDDQPFIGRSPSCGNVWYNCGHGHLGWTRGTGSSFLLVQLMCGLTPAIDASPYAPSRFQ